MIDPPPPDFTYPLPPVTSSQKQHNATLRVLITGINGYIASHIAYLLLQRGYSVLGTSRSSANFHRLLANPAFIPYAKHDSEGHHPRLQHIVVGDITIPHAFDEAVRGVHAIIHTASPVDFTLTSVDAFFSPAVDGVKSVLESAFRENLEHGGKIVSFVQLSSIAAVADKWRYPSIAEGGSENRAYTEADWNETGESVARTSEAADRDGKGKFLAMVAYGASKAAAERGMWNLAESKAQTKGTGLVCTSINPGVVMGPPVNWPQTPEKLNETLLPVWDIYSGKCKAEGKLPPQIGGATYCDIRDVAALHVWAMENPGLAGGERYLATSGKAPPQAIADVLRDVIYPHDEKIKQRIIVGEPGKGYVAGQGWPEDEPTVKSTKTFEAMKIDGFRPFEVMIRDTIDAFVSQWPNAELTT